MSGFLAHGHVARGVPGGTPTYYLLWWLRTRQICHFDRREKSSVRLLRFLDKLEMTFVRWAAFDKSNAYRYASSVGQNPLPVRVPRFTGEVLTFIFNQTPPAHTSPTPDGQNTAGKTGHHRSEPHNTFGQNHTATIRRTTPTDHSA